jgi:hypothetical protein
VIGAIRGLTILLAIVCAPALAAAQVYVPSDAPHGGSIEVGGGGTFVGGFEMGSSTADLTTSSPTGRYDLFTAASKVNSFPGVSAQVVYYLSRTIAVEGGFRYARPELSVELGDDVESAADVTATEKASHYVFGGSLVWHLREGGAAVPFVSGGAGYLRELHQGNQLVETGVEYHATAGLKYWLGSGQHRFGLRFEAGLSARENGFDDEDRRRVLPLVSAGISYLF